MKKREERARLVVAERAAIFEAVPAIQRDSRFKGYTDGLHRSIVTARDAASAKA